MDADERGCGHEKSPISAGLIGRREGLKSGGLQFFHLGDVQDGAVDAAGDIEVLG